MNSFRRMVSPSRASEGAAPWESYHSPQNTYMNALLAITSPDSLPDEADGESLPSFSGFSGIWWDGQSVPDDGKEDQQEGGDEEQSAGPRPQSHFSDSGSSSVSDANSYFGPEESSTDLDGLVLAAVRLDDVYDRFLQDRARYVPAQTPQEKLQIDELEDRWWKELHLEAMTIASQLERHDHDERYDRILAILERVHENQVGVSLLLRAVFSCLKAVPQRLEVDTTTDAHAGQRRQSVEHAGPSRLRQASVETIDRRGFPSQVGTSFPAGEAINVDVIDLDMENKVKKALAAFENWHKNRGLLTLVTRSSKKRKEDAEKL